MRSLPQTAKRVFVAVLVVLLVAALAWVVWQRNSTKTIRADFSQTKGIYAGDSVRMLGVEIGTITDISAVDGVSRVTMKVDDDVQIPADARAVLVAQSLVAERFIQFTPTYSGGPELEDNATVPEDRTAIPVEWDEIKTELMALSEALGPQEDNDNGALSDFVDATDGMLDGNGSAARNTLREMSATMETLSQGRTDLFSTVQNLQVFVTALAQSEEQIVGFSDHLSSVTQVFADQTGEIDAALNDLDLAIADVDRFLADNGDRISVNVDKLGQATQVLRDRRADTEAMLHTGAPALSNFYNIYRPYQGTFNGVFAPQWMASPMDFLCGAMQALANNTAQSDAALCASYMAPLVNSLAMHYPDFRLAPPYTPTAEPDQILNAQKPGTATAGAEQPGPGVPATLGNDVAAGANLSDLLAPGGGR